MPNRFARIPAAVCLTLALLSAPATAEDAGCRDRIAAMFDGGPLDPFVRPPHRFISTVLSPEGDTRYQFLTLWDTPARSISGILGAGPFTLNIDGDTWIGPDPEGPWTAAPNMMPPDLEAFQRAQLAQQQKNLADVACPGQVEIDGASYENIAFFTKTDPDEATGGGWFGAHNTVYLDPQTERVMRWEMTDQVSSFAPEVSADINVQIFDYDTPVRIVRPE
jgi:hypothetical protein